MNLESFNIDQRIKVQAKSSKGKNRIMEHGNIWRIKNKFKKNTQETIRVEYSNM